MKSEKIFEAIGNLDETLLAEALEKPVKKRDLARKFLGYGALAACLGLLLVGGVGMMRQGKEAQTFLEAEMARDPILAWEDPLTDEEYSAYEIAYANTPAAERTREKYEEFHRYAALRFQKSWAEANYPYYYYYLSGRSEYDGSRVAGHRNEWVSGTGLLSTSRTGPESFIDNMLADSCAILTPRGDGSMAVAEVLWGTLDEDTLMLAPQAVTPSMQKALADPYRQFVIFLHDTGKDWNTGEGRIGIYTYQTIGLFELENGVIEACTNLADVVRYDGERPADMVEAGVALAQKYPELLAKLAK